MKVHQLAQIRGLGIIVNIVNNPKVPSEYSNLSIHEVQAWRIPVNITPFE